ncbi:MAG: peptidase T [Chloroflexota bacterium]
MSSVVDRFLKYVRIDTESSRDSQSYPSTAKQLDLARLLRDELLEIGLVDVTLDDFAYVIGTLPANIEKKVPVVGFLAHMDTSPDMSGKDVKPQFVENYDGGDILLNKDKNIILSPKQFPDLNKYVGETLITTDGTTLLGADDKAGIAEIMTAMEYLIAHTEIKHGTIKIGFTPDEEVGRGVDNFDVEKFGADFAYTLDGGEAGELQFENFNAAEAALTIHGLNVHPGKSKNKMLNAILVGMEFNELLPVFERPEFTEKYEGFNHIFLFNGTVEEASMVYIIRDHDREKFAVKKALMLKAVAFMNEKYGIGTIDLTLTDQYYNMKEKVVPYPEIMTVAQEAIEAIGLTPIFEPVRGGTDGSRLSYMGLPTPNIFTGGHYGHGKFEFIPVFALEKGVEVVVKIAELLAQKV